MNNFKKVIISLCITILMIFLISFLVISPYLNSEYCDYQDAFLRNELSGKIQTMTIGSSNGMYAFDTEIIDNELNTVSYNLSGSLMTLDAKKFLLSKELDRNPIKTIVFDISYETLTRDETSEYALGNAYSIAKLDTSRERIQFIKNCSTYNDLLNLYSRNFISGLEFWLGKIKQINLHNVNYSLKGFVKGKKNDVSLSKDKVKQTYNTEKNNTFFRTENIKNLDEQIKLCQQNGINVILAVCPRSDAELWSKYDLDVFNQFMNDYAKRNHCMYVDMNLIKNRYKLFSDEASYYDIAHMSFEGASIFTKEFCKILKLSEREDVSKYFYDSYEDMKKDSPYMKYLK